MELTNKQEQGLRIAVDRYRHKEPFTVISGCAGTGKTTLISHIVSALNISSERVAYIAYTGKAAQVLRNKNCPNAMTAHRLLYKSILKDDGTYFHVPKNHLDENYLLIVVDEVSMLPQKMWDLLLSHHVHVLACGDPAQLPPVSGSTSVLDHPHIFLDEIMRQANDSEIIRLSADIREGKTITPYRGNEINIVRPQDFTESMMSWADQIICGKNATRHYLNTLYRKMLWGDQITNTPIVGDKVICLKNDWNQINKYGDALVNGTTGLITRINIASNYILGKKCIIDFNPDSYEELDASFDDLLIDWKLITTHEPTVTRENFRTFPKKLRPEEFDYGYAITCWKAQGSEYNKVLFFAERVGFMSKEEYIKYLYTGVTRAVQKLTLILDK